MTLWERNFQNATPPLQIVHENIQTFASVYLNGPHKGTPLETLRICIHLRVSIFSLNMGAYGSKNVKT